MFKTLTELSLYIDDILNTFYRDTFCKIHYKYTIIDKEAKTVLFYIDRTVCIFVAHQDETTELIRMIPYYDLGH